VLTAHMTAAPQPPRERAPERDISPALEAVVLHAIAKKPSRRYATATALATAIRRARVAPEDVEAVRPAPRAHGVADTTGARPVSIAPAPRPPVRSTRTWLLVCIVAALAGIVIGGWLSMRWDR
jgi:hypothetical protein